MSDYILLILWCSLFIFGWHYATLYTPNFIHDQALGQREIKPNDTEIAWWFRYYTRNLPKWIKKPLINCQMCMSSVYGSIFYWGYVLNTPGRINGLTIILWVAVVVAITGLNRIIKQIAQL